MNRKLLNAGLWRHRAGNETAEPVEEEHPLLLASDPVELDIDSEVLIWAGKSPGRQRHLAEPEEMA
jgi:hypothetical protein